MATTIKALRKRQAKRKQDEAIRYLLQDLDNCLDRSKHYKKLKKQLLRKLKKMGVKP